MPFHENPTSVRIPKSLKDFLRKRAYEDNRKLSALVVLILAEWRAAFLARRQADKAEKQP